MKKKCAVIQFPGSNCEYETIKALQNEGIPTEILPWNCSEDQFFEFSSYVLPGGFSFQDRIRAGAVASKLPIISFLKEADKNNLPILGICNGCQILAETGLVPDNSHKIKIALAPNMKDNKRFGFICDWVFVTIKKPKNNVFTQLFSEDDVIPIPVNHGEGNMKIIDDGSCDIENKTTLNYVDSKGVQHESFPTNPNGATANIAGLSNDKGNILAMMPHPERANLLMQIPHYIQSSWSHQKRHTLLSRSDKGPWSLLFQSLKQGMQ